MKNQNQLIGLLFVAVALIFGVNSFRYTLGSIDQPGPAMFPLGVSEFLLILGVISIIKGSMDAKEVINFKLKNIIIVSVSLLSFALVTDYINMIAGIVVLITIASFSASSYSIIRVVKIIVGLIAVAYAFKYLLGLNLPL